VTAGEHRDTGALLAYRAGELPAAAEAALEEHLFSCQRCAGELAALERVASGVRSLVRAGRFRSVVPSLLVTRLAEGGARIRTFRVAPGGTTPCGVAAEDELLVARLAADLRGVARLDLVIADDMGSEPERLPDVPFDPGSGEVIVTERVDRARSYPTHVVRFRLVGHGPSGEARTVGDYALAHDARGPPPGMP
jgi:hypothetical protein